MNNYLLSPQNTRDLKDPRHPFSRLFQERPINQVNPALISRISSSSTISSTPNFKASSNFLAKANTIKSDNERSPFILPLTVKHMLNFMESLMKRFEEEIESYRNNPRKLTQSSQTSTGDNDRQSSSFLNKIIQFDTFTLISKEQKTQFYKLESIIERFSGMIKALYEICQKLKGESLSKALPLQDETTFLRCLEKTLSEELLKNDNSRRVCAELWHLVRRQKRIPFQEAEIQAAFDNLKLFLYGISFPSPCVEDYPLHKAVFSNDLAVIRRICANEKSPVIHAHIEQSDPIGITPLMLAVLLGKKDAALVLVNHGANPKHRSYPYARTPLEEAIHRKNRGIIKTLLSAATSIKQMLWEENKKAFIEYLERMPDFSLEMNWECDSKIIPFVKKITPSDTYRVYKKGGSVRIDLSLLGFSKFRFTRGNSSIVFNGSGSGAEEGKLLLIDNNKKTSTDILAEKSSLSIENKVDELIKQEQMNSEVRAENVVFEPATNWRGEKIETNVNGYDCTKYIAKGTFSVLFTQRNTLLDINPSQFENFDEYFSHVKQAPLWVLEDKTGKVDWEQSPLIKINHFIECYQALVKKLFDKEGKRKDSSQLTTQKTGEKINTVQKKLVKEYNKNIVASVYLSNNLPLNLENLMPILEILSNVSPPINRLKAFLERTVSHHKNSFPVKACIPIFFSLNAMLTIQEFKLESPDGSLFNIDKLLQGKSSKNSDLFRDERYKTEGGSDDEHIQLRWQELMKQDSAQEMNNNHPINPIKFVYEDVGDEVELSEIQEKSQQFIHSFFRKNRESMENADYVDVFASDDDEDVIVDIDNTDDVKDHDTSERRINDSLKLNSHHTHIPKTLWLIEEKFKLNSPTKDLENIINNNINLQKDLMRSTDPGDHAMKYTKKRENINTLKVKENYKFLGGLNQQPIQRGSKLLPSKREPAESRNIVQVDLRDMKKKKERRCTLEKQQLSKILDPGKRPLNETKKKGDLIQKEVNESKLPKRQTHERIKSMEFSSKINFEAFIDKFWGNKG